MLRAHSCHRWIRLPAGGRSRRRVAAIQGLPHNQHACHSCRPEQAWQTAMGADAGMPLRAGTARNHGGRFECLHARCVIGFRRSITRVCQSSGLRRIDTATAAEARLLVQCCREVADSTSRDGLLDCRCVRYQTAGLLAAGSGFGLMPLKARQFRVSLCDPI